jgi:hypothetical protein
MPVKAAICVLLVVAVLTVGCGSSESTPAKEPTSTAAGSTTSQTKGDVPTLVGRWERVNECTQLVRALDQAGLRPIAPSVVGDYFPEASPKELARKDDLCAGAEPFVHYHFFDEAGKFGSLDENENQVDDGGYEILDGGRFRIGNIDFGVVFRYEIDGDALSLSPVLTAAMKKQALADPLKFSAAGWAVAVSYPGHEWKRVDCGGWC